MATVVNFDDEDKQNQNGGGQQSSTPNASLSANSSAAPTVTASSASTPTSSGRFTNIQNYFNANKPMADQMGNQVANNITQNGQEVKTSLNGAENTFNTKSQAGRLDKNSSLNTANNIIGNAGQQVYGTGTNPNNDVVSQFQRISSGQYLGPQGLDNAGTILANAQNAQTQGNLTANEPGRFTLLRNMFGTPTYSQGQTNLDNLLLSNQTGVLNQARQSVMGLPQQANQGAEQAQLQANYYNKEANDVGNTVRNQLSTAQGASQTDLQNALKAAQTAEMNRVNHFNNVTTSLAGDGGTISASDAARLGLGTAPGVVNTYGLNPLDYIKTNMSSVPINVNTVANQDQAAKANALALLAGQTGPIDFSQVGKFQGSTQSIDPAYFSALQAAQDKFNSLQAQDDVINNKYNNLQNIYNSLSDQRQRAAIDASTGSNPQQGVAAANAAVSNSPQFDQLMQALYGGQQQRDVGFLNQAGSQIASRRASDLGDIEQQLAKMRTKFNIAPDETKQS